MNVFRLPDQTICMYLPAFHTTKVPPVQLITQYG